MLNKNKIEVNIKDNTSKQITPEKLREVLHQMDVECGLGTLNWNISTDLEFFDVSNDARTSNVVNNYLDNQGDHTFYFWQDKKVVVNIEAINQDWRNYEPKLRFERYKKKNSTLKREIDPSSGKRKDVWKKKRGGFRFESIRSENAIPRNNLWIPNPSNSLDLKLWTYFGYDLSGNTNDLYYLVKPLGNKRNSFAPNWYAAFNGRFALDLTVEDIVVTIYSPTFKIMSHSDYNTNGSPIIIKTGIRMI